MYEQSWVKFWRHPAFRIFRMSWNSRKGKRVGGTAQSSFRVSFSRKDGLKCWSIAPKFVSRSSRCFRHFRNFPDFHQKMVGATAAPNPPSTRAGGQDEGSLCKLLELHTFLYCFFHTVRIMIRMMVTMIIIMLTMRLRNAISGFSWEFLAKR